jgi:hypothetical protein
VCTTIPRRLGCGCTVGSGPGPGPGHGESVCAPGRGRISCHSQRARASHLDVGKLADGGGRNGSLFVLRILGLIGLLCQVPSGLLMKQYRAPQSEYGVVEHAGAGVYSMMSLSAASMKISRLVAYLVISPCATEKTILSRTSIRLVFLVNLVVDTRDSPSSVYVCQHRRYVSLYYGIVAKKDNRNTYHSLQQPLRYSVNTRNVIL